MTLTPSGPLLGVRVLELSQIVSLPFCGVLLADLGADVIKVESLTGDEHRDRGALVKGHGKRFQSLNRGKRSLSIDLRSPQGRETFLRLAPNVDVVMNNFRSGVAERLGVGYDDLRAVRPDIVYAEITGFGNRGPMARRAASDVVAGAYSGLTFGDMKTDADGLPLQVTSFSTADYLSGLSAALGIVAALRHRDLTGEGQHVATSLLAAAMAVQDTSVMRDPLHDAAMRDPMIEQLDEARRAGAPYPELVEIYRGGRGVVSTAFRVYYRAYQASDGYVVLGALTRAGRDAIRTVTGVTDDPSDDEGYDARDPENVAFAERLHERMEALFRTRSTEEWMRELAEAGAPVSPLNVPEEMSENDQVVAMGFVPEIDNPLFGKQRVAGSPLWMSATPPAVQGPSPSLGEHTAEVLRDVGGLGAEEVAALLQAGVIRVAEGSPPD